MPPSPDPLPIRWVVILLAAGLVALSVGALTFAQSTSWPASLLASLAASGATIVAGHQIMGR